MQFYKSRWIAVYGIASCLPLLLMALLLYVLLKAQLMVQSSLILLSMIWYFLFDHLFFSIQVENFNSFLALILTLSLTVFW